MSEDDEGELTGHFFEWVIRNGSELAWWSTSHGVMGARCDRARFADRSDARAVLGAVLPTHPTAKLVRVRRRVYFV